MFEVGIGPDFTPLFLAILGALLRLFGLEALGLGLRGLLGYKVYRVEAFSSDTS